MNIQVEDYLRNDGPGRGIRDDWEVRTGPAGVVVNAWTRDRFLRPDQATHVAERVLHDILELGYRVAGPCDMEARRDADGDWRGYLAVRLQPPASTPASARSVAGQRG